MGRTLVFVYGLVSYVGFLAVFMYLIGFLGNFLVPKSIDDGVEGSMSAALIINGALLALFGIQHTVMARPTFKKWWTSTVPWHLERSTYVLITNLILALLYWQWRPMTGVIWHVDNSAGRIVLWSLFGAGWLLVFVATVQINHFDLFGLRQVWLHLRSQKYTPVGFVMPVLYKYVRHPLYLGWMTGFWATPEMSAGHLVFAIGTTMYMLIAIKFEERNLVQFHGDPYSEYRKKVPMIIPHPFKRSPPKAQP